MKVMKSSPIFLVILTIFLCTIQPVQAANTLSGIQLFPSDYVWNVPVDTLPIHTNSSNYITSENGASGNLYAAFGYTATSGYAYDIVDSSTSKYTIAWKYPSSSFGTIPVPIPSPRPGIYPGTITNGLCSVDEGDDCHAIIIDQDSKVLYELFGMRGNQFPNGSWDVKSGGVWNLSNYSLGYGTSTASGIPLTAGLIRYDEIEAGSINHAIRLALPYTRYGGNLHGENYTWPARFSNTIFTKNWSTNYPRMGERFRLKSSFDISGYSPTNQVILTALKKYGMIVADNGNTQPEETWQITAMHDSRWDWEDLSALSTIKGTDLEAVDESSLMLSPDSGQVTFIPLLTVTSPNGGETWLRGTTPTITWTSAGNVGSNVKIEVLKAGTVVQTISSPTTNDGSFSGWTVPTGLTISTDYKIRITSISNPAITDSSDSTFTITDPIVVTSPNGGETWVRGTTPTITWTFLDSAGKDVKIELLKAGTAVQTIAVWTPNDGSVNSWTVPTSLPTGTDYKVRVTSYYYSGISDTSDNTFIISDSIVSPTPTPAPLITVASPNGGEIWVRGTTPTITWTSSGSAGKDVKIELLKAGTVIQTIAVWTPNDGSVNSWTVPTSLPTGTDYKVRVTSYYYPAISDTSDSNFTLTS
jgi:hypothetical protein